MKQSVGRSSADGNFTVIDGPGAIGTRAFRIDRYGAVTGLYTDSNKLVHGYVRAAGGTFTTFDGPDATTTSPIGINDSGAAIGFFVTSTGAVYLFIRSPDGTFTSFDPPNFDRHYDC